MMLVRILESRSAVTVLLAREHFAKEDPECIALTQISGDRREKPRRLHLM